ncbi:MAG TPA: type IV-A pilus assembly ATPase PilB [Gemmatimonadales bacterium]|jgi:type IV pilus assembly protein PilB
MTVPNAAPANQPHDAAGATERLGELLLSQGLVTREQLASALKEHKTSNLRLGLILTRQGAIDELELTKILARQYRMPAVDLSRFEVDPRMLKLVPADLALKRMVLPLKREGRTLTVAVADPADQGLLEDLKFITRYDLFAVLAGEQTLRTLIERHYESSDEQLQTILKEMEGISEDVEVVADEEESEAAAAAAVAQALLDDAPVVKLINGVLTDAVKRGASDIHIEPFEHEIRIRYRIDGALQEVMKPPLKMKAALTSRIKILSALNIAERRVPQDGRLKLKMGSRVIDFRVSTLPVLFGEKIVLRILDKGNLTLDLAKFGFEPKAEADLMKAILNPYGMVLVTGPTGSGKTTTLYSALQRINTVDTNIMTAEDPVEYNLPGINQSPMRAEIGLTFAAALRAFLRQDPNIIMIGEIRDLETGGIAIKAALTGHLVLSTLHTNDAPSTIVRMIDMGIEAFNVASAVNLVVAQRLVRRICNQCKAPATYSDEELASLSTDVSVVRHISFFKGTGCDNCGGTGYRGRAGLYEVMAMTPALRRMVLTGGSVAELRDQAVVDGMLTLRMDGMKKLERGVTTLEEVVKETSE